MSRSAARTRRQTKRPTAPPVDLPDDVLLEIATQTNGEELVRLCGTSRRMSDLCQRADIWRRRFLAEFGEPSRPPADWRAAYVVRLRNVFTTLEHLRGQKAEFAAGMPQFSGINYWRQKSIVVLPNPHVMEALARVMFDVLRDTLKLAEPAPGVLTYPPNRRRDYIGESDIHTIAKELSDAFGWDFSGDDDDDVYDQFNANIKHFLPRLILDPTTAIVSE